MKHGEEDKMVKENKEMKCYYCEECEMAYVDKKKACQCEEWCKKHKSCSLEITKYAINKMGMSKK